ncbi:MAG: hypothetical protein AAGF50_00980 [Pseudomonadota bacterium]
MTPEERLKKIYQTASNTTNFNTPHDSVHNIFVILREMACGETFTDENVAYAVNWMANEGIEAMFAISEHNAKIMKLANPDKPLKN